MIILSSETKMFLSMTKDASCVSQIITTVSLVVFNSSIEIRHEEISLTLVDKSINTLKAVGSKSSSGTCINVFG